MSFLDPRSVIFVLLVVTAGLTLQLVLTASRRPGERALRWWTVAAAQGVFAIVLFVARGTIPDFVSIWVANVLIASTYLTLWLGLHVFDGKPPPVRPALGLLAAFAVVFGAMYFAGAGLPARIMFISVCMSGLCWLTVRGLAADRALPSRVFAAGLLGTQATLFLVRAVTTWMFPPGDDFMKPDALQITFLVLQALFSPLWIVSLLAMTGERAQAQLVAALAEQRRASDAKSEFLRHLAHEVRTPLGAVSGFAELIREGTAETTVRAQAGHILSAAAHVISLSDELLDLARIESGKVAIEPRDIDVAAAVHEALAMLRAPFDAKRIRVALHTPVPIRLSADPRLLRQILLNVLGNAAKFGRDDGHVEVRMTADAAGACFAIADDGPGIAAADPNALFEPFARGTGMTTVEGSGLGLPIVKGLVEAHGGRVEIDSRPGRGTTIRLHFPANRVR